MINAMVLTWFIVGIAGTVLRCFFHQRQLPAYVQPVVVLYSVLPLMIPFSWAALGAVAIVVPYGLHRYFSSNRMINLLALFGVWLPFECGWLQVPFDTHLPVDYAVILLAFFSIFISFSSSRPLALFINSFRLTRSDVMMAVWGVAGLLMVIIPLGFVIGFLSVNVFDPSWMFFIETIAIGYFLYALPEELLFRFLMFDFFRPFFGSERFRLVITSVVFGLAHLNNRTAGMVGLNWGYVILATIAGVGYGIVYMKTRKVSASAITHALINMTWGMFFNSPY